MTPMDMWLTAVAAAALINIVLGIVLLLRKQNDGSERLATLLRDELRTVREEGAGQARQLREEISTAQQRAAGGTEARLDSVRALLNEQLRALMDDQRKHLEQVVAALNSATEINRRELQAARESLDTRFAEIRASNEQKLDEMRQTVDEKLQGTLEKRLGESFRQVSERLEAVQRGLGEMKSLADGVGDLKRVLTNVKERGTWGEYQLAAILEQVLTPDQYESNVRPTAGGETVEFAIKLPGRHADGDGAHVWLPIDAKFPREDYERLLAASEAADIDAVRTATNALAAAIKKSARDIQSKYIAPPSTTDFAILFLPTEGLYAEVLRQPGLADELRSKFHVLVAGPTTLAALLNSLRVGFHTLAIEKSSAEVWKVLGTVKAEFAKFGTVLDKVKGHLAKASSSIEDVEKRTGLMTRKLRDVELAPAVDAAELLVVLPEETIEEPGEETEENA